MEVSIDPILALKKILDGKKEKKRAVAEYLDLIAEEAAALALVWEETVKAVLVEGEYEVPEKDKIKLYSYRIDRCNAQSFSRIEDYFNNVSSVMGEKFNDEMNSIIFHISHLIKTRNLTKELIQKEITELDKVMFLDSSNKKSYFADINKSVSALHKEAAALHARAVLFKAN